MIPLTICNLDDPSNMFMAVGIVVCAAVIGFAGAKLLSRQHAICTVAFLIVIGASLPVAAAMGIAPFDSRWRYDCGVTPDANILVYFALLGYPFVVLLSGFIGRRVYKPR